MTDGNAEKPALSYPDDGDSIASLAFHNFSHIANVVLQTSQAIGSHLRAHAVDLALKCVLLVPKHPGQQYCCGG
jgi:hypothetical protein